MLFIVRHGRTEANAAGRLLGRADPPLDEVGQVQAHALAARIGPVDRVVSSPLRRARATAAAIASSVGVDVDVDERFVELDYGTLDGTLLSDIPASFWLDWRADATFAPPGGESLRDLGARVRAACDALAGEADRRDVVVVTHVSPIKAALAWALGVGDEIAWRSHVAPGSLMRIAIINRGPVVHSFNEVPSATSA